MKIHTSILKFQEEVLICAQALSIAKSAGKFLQLQDPTTSISTLALYMTLIHVNASGQTWTEMNNIDHINTQHWSSYLSSPRTTTRPLFHILQADPKPVT